MSKNDFLRATSFVAVFVVFLSYAVLPVVAGDIGAFSTNEAKQLVLKSFQFYYKYQFSDKVLVKNRTDISAEARSIYSDDIADDMWMKRCYGSKNMPLYAMLCYNIGQLESGRQETEPGYYNIALNYYRNQIDRLYGNDGKTYTDNGDGTVSILPFASGIMDWREFDDKHYGRNIESQYQFWRFVISKEYSSDYFSEKIRPACTDDVEIRSLSVTGNSAACEVLVYHDNHPVWADARFELTVNGWRISGGDLVYVLSDWSEVAEKEFFPPDVKEGLGPTDGFDHSAPVSRSNHLLKDLPCVLIILRHLEDEKYLDSNWTPEEYADCYYHMFGSFNSNAGAFKFISQTGNKAVYEIECVTWTTEFGTNSIGEKDQVFIRYLNNYGTHTAEFTYDPDYKYVPMHVPSRSLTGAWRLTGGEWYDIVTGKTEAHFAPYTGDDRLITLFSLCIASFVCAAVSLWIAVNRRKKGRLNP